MKKLLPFIHPLLFALYPVIFLYSFNIKEYTEESIIIPALVSLLFAFVVLIITKLIFRRVQQATIVASYIIFVALSYERLRGIVGLAGNPAIFLLIVVGLFLLLLMCIKKYKDALPKVNQFLTLIAAVLIAFSLFNIIMFEAKTGRIFETIKQPLHLSTVDPEPSTTDSPDIYYFIFDRYAGPKSLKNEYGIDNTEFLNFLKEKGFYVAEDSTTNYPKTFLSLASSLSMDYLDALATQTNGGASPDQSLATPLIRNSRVLNFLKERGYYTINIGPSTWKPTSVNPYADVNFEMKEGTYPFVDPFGTGYFNMTIAEPIFKKIFYNPLDVSRKPDNNEHRRLAVFELDSLKKAVSAKSPKFVFMHILFPHDPFVFDENCKPVAESVTDKNDHITNYTKQLKCANTKMEEIINNILANSKTPPIIILQSDEGPFPMKEPVAANEAWIDATDVALNEKFPILNAYYFPGEKNDALYQSITPVNSFRVLFNTYFGQNNPLLQDRNYVFKDNENYYKFTDVTERVK